MSTDQLPDVHILAQDVLDGAMSYTDAYLEIVNYDWPVPALQFKAEFKLTQLVTNAQFKQSSKYYTDEIQVNPARTYQQDVSCLTPEKRAEVLDSMPERAKAEREREAKLVAERDALRNARKARAEADAKYRRKLERTERIRKRMQKHAEFMEELGFGNSGMLSSE